MQVHETKLRGVFVIECDVFADDRGAVMPAWIGGELAARGLDPTVAQCNLVQNHRRGTLRGMHYQRTPFGECKLIRCVRGAVYDVIVDLRADRSSFRTWYAVELSADNGRMLYVPEGIAHGYITLVDDSDMLYFLSAPYRADHAAGVRWNDPGFGIAWPRSPRVISERDAAFPDYAP